MQTQTTTEPVAPEPTVAELDAQIEAAEAELEKLNEAAEKAQNEAEKANVAFEAEPTAASHAGAAVAAQRALNARKAAFSQREGVLAPLRHKRQRLMDDAERQRLTEVMHPARIGAISERMRSAVTAMVAELDASYAELATLLQERHEASSRATSLGVRFERIAFDTVIDTLSQELHTLLRNERLDPHKTACSCVFGDTGSSLPVVHLELNRPINVNSYTRHR